MKAAQLPVEDLMYPNNEYPAPGAVFRLTENALIAKLERLIHRMPGVFEIRETAGIHQVYLLKQVHMEMNLLVMMQMQMVYVMM